MSQPHIGQDSVALDAPALDLGEEWAGILATEVSWEPDDALEVEGVQDEELAEDHGTKLTTAEDHIRQIEEAYRARRRTFAVTIEDADEDSEDDGDDEDDEGREDLTEDDNEWYALWQEDEEDLDIWDLELDARERLYSGFLQELTGIGKYYLMNFANTHTEDMY